MRRWILVGYGRAHPDRSLTHGIEIDAVETGIVTGFGHGHRTIVVVVVVAIVIIVASSTFGGPIRHTVSGVLVGMVPVGVDLAG